MVNLKLHFSHVVVAFHAVSQWDGNIVLCYLPNNTVTPFVTWRVDVFGACYLGHYFSTAAAAAADYAERTGLASDSELIASLVKEPQVQVRYRPGELLDTVA